MTRRFEFEISAILVGFREAVFNETLGVLLGYPYQVCVHAPHLDFHFDSSLYRFTFSHTHLAKSTSTLATHVHVHR